MGCLLAEKFVAMVKLEHRYFCLGGEIKSLPCMMMLMRVSWLSKWLRGKKGCGLEMRPN